MQSARSQTESATAGDFAEVLAELPILAMLESQRSRDKPRELLTVAEVVRKIRKSEDTVIRHIRRHRRIQHGRRNEAGPVGDRGSRGCPIP